MTDFPSLEDVDYEVSRLDYDSDSQIRQHATSDAWRASSKLEKSRELRKALIHQRLLENASKKLALLASKRTTQHADQLNQLVEEIESSVAGLNKSFSQLASTRLFNERRPASSVAATKVLQIPELLERICLFTEARDLLRLQQVNKTIYHAIERSSALQRMLHLRPSSNHFLTTPFSDATKTPLRYAKPLEFPGFVCYHQAGHFDYGTSTMTASHTSHIVAKFTQLDLPKLGARCRQMLICDPPIYEMKVYPLCCSPNPIDNGEVPSEWETRHDRIDPFWRLSSSATITAAEPLRSSEIARVTSSSGLTIGDLYDADVRTREAHRMCPFASRFAHQDSGEVLTTVSFGGEVNLDPTDPMLSSPPPLFPPALPFDVDEFDRRRLKFDEYIEAKQNALVAGRPIPTLKEFENAQPASFI